MEIKERYSDEELEEFRQLINEKLAAATEIFESLCATVRGDGNGTHDTSPTFKTLEEGASVWEKEEAARQAQRQKEYIDHLKAALVRIDRKVYGICRISGKLIPKERLRAVPHATVCVQEKLNRK